MRQEYKQYIIAFDRATIYVFQSRGFYDVSRMQVISGLTDSLDSDLMLADEMDLDELKLFYYEFQKYEVMTTSVVGQPKKHANHCYKVKHTSNAPF